MVTSDAVMSALKVLALAALAMVFAGAVTVYFGGGPVMLAVVIVLLAVAYHIVPRYRFSLHRASD